MSDQLTNVVAKWLNGVRPEHRDLLIQLHSLLMETEPGFNVALKWSQPTYSAGDQMFAYIADQTDYVHLGFYNGAQFDDPHGPDRRHRQAAAPHQGLDAR